MRGRGDPDKRVLVGAFILLFFLSYAMPPYPVQVYAYGSHYCPAASNICLYNFAFLAESRRVNSLQDCLAS